MPGAPGGRGRKSHRKKLQEKTQENLYFTLNYKENSGFPGFFPGVFFYEGFFGALRVVFFAYTCRVSKEKNMADLRPKKKGNKRKTYYIHESLWVVFCS